MLANDGSQGSDDILFTEVFAPLGRLCQLAKEVRWSGAVVGPGMLALITAMSELDVPVVLNGIARKGPQGLRNPRLYLDHIKQILILSCQLLP